MTNKEILQASLLDILFDNRNKDYGAYTLRRDYNHRLLAAICTALVPAFLLFMLLSFGKKNLEQVKQVSEGGPVIIRKVEIPPDKPKAPKKSKAISKPAPKIASIKSVNKIVITDNFKVKKIEIPDINELAKTVISNINSPGIPSIGTVKAGETISTGAENPGAQKKEADFKPDQREPEFPGGQQALIRFLRNNLNSPGDLQAGETIMVHIRFLVGADGLVSQFEVIQSGGTEFDNEVKRVCKRMPRWKPAYQNGSNVAVSYVLPVTFIGVEQ